mmetsp:Transcript_58184/g.138541  ORF Transcript_58184/g.138541 Transcript_58184/m.138541 type:complete len:518 (+) Transcript_58184:141-1694(+)
MAAAALQGNLIIKNTFLDTQEPVDDDAQPPNRRYKTMPTTGSPGGPEDLVDMENLPLPEEPQPTLLGQEDKLKTLPVSDLSGKPQGAPGPEIPVHNTFVHFGRSDSLNESRGHGGRQFKTTPQEYTEKIYPEDDSSESPPPAGRRGGFKTNDPFEGDGDVDGDDDDAESDRSGPRSNNYRQSLMTVDQFETDDLPTRAGGQSAAFKTCDNFEDLDVNPEFTYYAQQPVHAPLPAAHPPQGLAPPHAPLPSEPNRGAPSSPTRTVQLDALLPPLQTSGHTAAAGFPPPPVPPFLPPNLHSLHSLSFGGMLPPWPAPMLQHPSLFPPTAAGPPLYAPLPPTSNANGGLPQPPQMDRNANPRSGVAAPKACPKGMRRPARYWVHIYLHMNEEGFDLVPMFIGRSGCNVKKIAEATGAKLRIRGKGSGHKEGPDGEEAPVPLMVAVTTDKTDAEHFREAVRMTLVELQRVSQRFDEFIAKNNKQFSGPYFSIAVVGEGGKEHLHGLYDPSLEGPSSPGRKG